MHPRQEKGFIQFIFIIILIIIVLSLLGVSLRSLFSNTTLQDNFGVVGEWLSKIWHSTLATPLRYIFGQVIQPIWERFLDALRNFSFNRPS